MGELGRIFACGCGAKHRRRAGAIERRPHRPVERIAIVGPADVVGPALARAHHRERACLLAHSDRLPAGQQGHGEDFVILAEGDVTAIRRDAEIIGKFAFGMDPNRFAVEIGGKQLQFARGIAHHEDAVVVGAKLRHAVAA